MDNTIGMNPDQAYSGPDQDHEEPEEEERDWDAENDYRDDLDDLHEGK